MKSENNPESPTTPTHQNGNTTNETNGNNNDTHAATNGTYRTNGIHRPLTPDGQRKPFLIGVTGGTASGKTSVCEEIIEQVKQDPDLATAKVTILSQDIFYTELNDDQLRSAHEGNFNFDHPNAFDFDMFERVLRELATGKPVVKVPTYSYVTHSRTGWVDFENADVIIVEGILVLYAKAIREMFEMKIFVDCDADTRLARRVFRDIEERGRSVENVLHQYCEHVKPAFEEFCRPTKKYVDIILPKGRENIVAINLIAQHVHDLLKGSVDARARRTSLARSNSVSPDGDYHKKKTKKKLAEELATPVKNQLTRPH